MNRGTMLRSDVELQETARAGRPENARLWRLLTVLGVLIFLSGSLLHLVLGRLNSDEGWYLYASRLALHGQVPVRDFAYTQMPLLPYVYGVGQQLFDGSLYAGRATSVALSTLTVLAAIWIARRYAGALAGAITALLFAAFTHEMYYQAIVKTFALVSLCFMLAWLALNSRLRDEIRYPLATTFALLAVWSRLSALLFAVPVILYCLFAPERPRWRTRTLVLVPVALSVVLAAWIFLPDPEEARWHLLHHHVSQWGDASVTDRLSVIMRTRLPNAARMFTAFLLLATVCLYAGRSLLLRDRSLLVIGMGLTLFAASHFTSGGWHYEYFVPAVFSSFPLLAILLAGLISRGRRHGDPQVAVGVLVAVLILAPMAQGIEFIDRSGDRLPVAEVQEVARFVAANSSPGDKVFALEALSVAVEADRELLPGLSLAHFSYESLETERARDLHVINFDIAVEYVRSRQPAVIILTARDWAMLERRGVYDLTPNDPEPFRQAVSENYQEAYRMDDFGQFRGTVVVYLPTASQAEVE